MKKIFYGILVIVIIASIYILMRPKTISVEIYEVRLGNFEETFSADGKIRASIRQTVYAYATGSIGNLDIRVGDIVSKGQSVGTLEWDMFQPVKVPMDGVISKVYRDSAGPILRGEPLFEVSSLSKIEVVADVLTPDAIRLKMNGEAWVQNWGGVEDLEARIVQISRAGAVKMSALGVEEERADVKLEFVRVPKEFKSKLGDNYHVDVLFVVSRETNVLSVPLGALFKNGETWAVYVVRQGKARLQEVNISKRNNRFAMVTQGVTAGDQVILFPGDKIFEGATVRRE